MRFGVFSLSQFPDQDLRVQGMDESIEQFVLAEELGYDTAWVAEHLFSTYGIVASCQVLAAALAMRTSTIRIGTAVSCIPFNHPLKTASDYALVDILSHGRLDFGAGRAYQPHEFVGMGVPMDKSRAMFEEGLDIITAAWTEPTVKHTGEFWTIPEPITVYPKPVQQPHPPIYMATISPDSFRAAARRGVNLQLATPFTYRLYREAWIDELEKNVRAYEEEAESLGRDPRAAERAMLVPFFVAPTEAEAIARYQGPVEWFYSKVSSHERVPGQEEKLVAGYEMHMREGKTTKEGGYLAFEQLHKYGAAVASDPKGCIAHLRELQERIGVTEFIFWMNIGGIADEHARASMHLAAAEVFPAFR